MLRCVLPSRVGGHTLSMRRCDHQRARSRCRSRCRGSTRRERRPHLGRLSSSRAALCPARMLRCLLPSRVGRRSPSMRRCDDQRARSRCRSRCRGSTRRKQRPHLGHFCSSRAPICPARMLCCVLPSSVGRRPPSMRRCDDQRARSRCRSRCRGSTRRERRPHLRLFSSRWAPLLPPGLSSRWPRAPRPSGTFPAPCPDCCPSCC